MSAASLSELAGILHEITGIPTDRVVPEAAFDADLDVDSLSMVEVVVACEEKFGVRIPDEDLDKLVTVGDALAYIDAAGVPA